MNMKTMAKIVWAMIVITTAAFAAIVPLAALVGSILIPATMWGWAYNHTLAIATIVGFLGFISWGFTWVGLMTIIGHKISGQ